MEQFLRGAIDLFFVTVLHAKQPMFSDQRNVLSSRIFNLGYDPMEELPLRCPEQAVRFEHLTPDGVWKPLAVRRDNGRTILPVRLECGEMAAIRVVPGAGDAHHGN